jgi:hypothetical protein
LIKNFQDTLNIITDRYGLAKIEDMVVNGNGFLGRNVSLNIPNGPAANINALKRTIHSLTGRIFVVKNITGLGPRIVSTSSGMIIPRISGKGTEYDQIITCCHSMVSADSSPDLEFYFVRSQHLDPETGLPNPATIGAAIPALVLAPGQTYDQVVDIQHFITYLRQKSKATTRTDNHVRRIIKFKALYGKISEPEHHIPRYNPEADCGYGFLNTGFSFPATANFAKIQILKNLPAQAGSYDYYALGYAVFPYYDITASSLLAQRLQLSPFTMTKSRSNVPDPLHPGSFMLTHLNNGFIRHIATSMKGMSGGPVLIFDSARTQINIFGVVSSGYMDESYACKF